MPVLQADSSNLLSSQEKGNNNAQWWQAQVMSTLGADRWMRVGLRQLSGMLVMVFALSSLSVKSWSCTTHVPVIKAALCLSGMVQATCMVLCNIPYVLMCLSANFLLTHAFFSHDRLVAALMICVLLGTLMSCNKGYIMPVRCGTSTVHGAVYHHQMLHGYCVTHLLCCGKTPAAAAFTTI